MHTGPSEVSCQSLCDSPETTQSMPPGTFEVSLNNKKKKKGKKRATNPATTRLCVFTSPTRRETARCFFFFFHSNPFLRLKAKQISHPVSFAQNFKRDCGVQKSRRRQPKRVLYEIFFLKMLRWGEVKVSERRKLCGGVLFACKSRLITTFQCGTTQNEPLRLLPASRLGNFAF